MHYVELDDGPLSRMLPFSGVGIGVGLGVGCGAGVGSGLGGIGLSNVKIPGFGFGGGCGAGFGFGWGFFLFSFGTPVKTMSDILGINDRILDRAHEKLLRERAEGIRKPFSGGLPDELRTNDPILDRVIRTIISRRAKARKLAPRNRALPEPTQ